VNNIGKHGSSKIKAKHMYFIPKGTLNKFQNPLDHSALQISTHKILLDGTFLQYGKTEPLSNIAILLLLQYLDNPLDNNIIAIVGNILDALDG